MALTRTLYGANSIANPSKLIELCDQILSRTETVRHECLEPYGEYVYGLLFSAGAYGNWGKPLSSESPEFQQRVAIAPKMAQDFIESSRTREAACYNCGLRCRHVYPLPDGGYLSGKCANLLSSSFASKIFDLDLSAKFYGLSMKYGVDCQRMVNHIMFAIDLYERGILNKGDTDGMHLEWENPEVMFSLFEKIVRREGIGDVLANGVYRAAQQIGRGAEKYAVTTKKNETLHFTSVGHRYPLYEAINDRADRTKFDNIMQSVIWLRSKEEKEAYLKSGFFSYPKEYEKYLLTDFDYTGQNYEPTEQFSSYDEETYLLADMTGLCYYWVRWFPYPPINGRALIADLISCTALPPKRIPLPMLELKIV